MRNGVTIYFVRHGQTDWNAEKRLQGQTDIPLNELGRAQARRNGRVLAERLVDPSGLDYVASPLGRARETIEILRAELGLTANGYRLDDRLQEIHLGRWQGSTWKELRVVMPDVVEARFADLWNTVAPGPGGESYAMLSARTLDWLAGVRHDTVVASHGGVNRCLRAHFEGLETATVPRLEVPQDRVMVIRNGALEWL